ncbi:hypothetical protein CYMTET_37980 [Cymbomonas tetramitiformis]|uniref:Glycosyl transferase CAP10 domain-containing protein n=1 Tax=Cymbomonas tetramitiformis TaxID=36881 RepID=A0AAE0CF60_9CHLO|nr:hypothetical protein CYMTET_37980 [Cymbomonas tetramitiformis]
MKAARATARLLVFQLVFAVLLLTCQGLQETVLAANEEANVTQELILRHKTLESATKNARKRHLMRSNHEKKRAAAAVERKRLAVRAWTKVQESHAVSTASTKRIETCTELKEIARVMYGCHRLYCFKFSSRLAKVESATQVCGAVSKWRLTLVSDFLREVAVRMYKDGVALVSLSERGNPLWSSKDEEYLRMRGAPLVTMWRMKGRRAPVLIPDSAFLRYRGFHQIREQVLWMSEARPWEEKAASAVWRGDAVGYSEYILDYDNKTAPAIPTYAPVDEGTVMQLPRVKLCEAAKTLPAALTFDCGITPRKGRHGRGIDRARARKQGSVLNAVAGLLKKSNLVKKPIDGNETLSHRVLVDIDGEANSPGAWWKLLSNSLVVKVDSPFEEWWHAPLQPGVHYLAAQRNLSNFAEVLERALDPTQAEEMKQIAGAAAWLFDDLVEYSYDFQVDRLARCLSAIFSQATNQSRLWCEQQDATDNSMDITENEQLASHRRQHPLRDKPWRTWVPRAAWKLLDDEKVQEGNETGGRSRARDLWGRRRWRRGEGRWESRQKWLNRANRNPRDAVGAGQRPSNSKEPLGSIEEREQADTLISSPSASKAPQSWDNHSSTIKLLNSARYPQNK